MLGTPNNSLQYGSYRNGAELHLHHGMGSGPLLSRCYRCWLILLPSLGYVWGERIVWVWRAKECLDRQQDRADLKSWRPVALQNIQADTAKLVDVRVVDLGQETNLWWGHRVVIWEEELKVEDAALVWRLRWAVDLDVEVSEVIVVRNCADARDRLSHQTLSLFDNTLWKRHFDCLYVVEVVVVDLSGPRCRWSLLFGGVWRGKAARGRKVKIHLDTKSGSGSGYIASFG